MDDYTLTKYLDSLSQEQKDHLLRAILVNMRLESFAFKIDHTEVSFSVKGIRYSNEDNGFGRVFAQHDEYSEALFDLAAQMHQI